MMKDYHWLIAISVFLALSSLVAQEAESNANDLVRAYIEGQGHLPRNRELSRKIDEVADEIAPLLRTELEHRTDGDSLIAIARLATRVPDKSEAKDLISAVSEKIARIEGYSSDPLVAQNLRELERLIDDAAPLGLGKAKAESAGTDNGTDAVKQGDQIGEAGLSKKEQESIIEKSPSPSSSPVWPYVLVAVALVGIAVVLLRTRKGNPDR